MSLYELEDAAKLIGVPKRKMSDFCHKGYIIPQHQSGKQGRPRKFSQLNLLEAKIVNVLVSTYKPGKVAQVMEIWRKFIAFDHSLRERLVGASLEGDSMFSELHLHIDETNVCLVGRNLLNYVLGEKDNIWCYSLDGKNRKPEHVDSVPKPDRTQFVLNLLKL